VEQSFATIDWAQQRESIALAVPAGWSETAPFWLAVGGDTPSGLPCQAAPVALFADPLHLFRRAIVEGDQAAWETLYGRYRRLVGSWLRRHSASPLVGEADDYLINRTFERFWLYVKPERFDSFAGLPALLQYLKLCAHGVLMDEVRSQARRQAMHGCDHAQPPNLDDIGEREAAHILWQAISAEVRDELERLIATLSFVQGLKPREIYKQHPEQFADVAEVYRIKRNLLDRLRRDETIRLLGE
jgi:DNA-directed RNA polymerase specialized sigma24 family protein